MALESLAPDQRAVVELVLKQGRSYAELAGLLEISEDAVRRRAHAGLAVLGTDNGLDAQERGRVTDYLLGQLDEDGRAATAAMLSNSRSVRAWAREVAEKLQPVARRQLPTLPPEPPSGAGSEPPEAPSGAGSEPPEAPSAVGSEPSARSSRLGGAVLIGVCTVLLASLVVWLLSRDDGAGSAPEPAGATRSTPTPTPTPQALAVIPLRAVGDSDAEGALEVNANQEGQVGIIVEASNVKPSGQGEAYAVWLTDSRRKAFRLGFEAKDSGTQVAQAGTLAFAGPSPDVDRAKFTRALTQYDRLVVSLETSDTATRPAAVLLRGSLKRLQGGDAEAPE